MPTTFWWLWSAALLSALATFVFPFLAFFLTARGLDAVQAGLAVSLFGLGAAIGSPVGGQLADRVGRRPTLLAALLASAASAIALGFADGLAAIFALLIVFGFATAGVRPAIHAVVADLLADQQRRRGFGLLYWANNVGIGVSLLIGGFFAQRHFRALFALDGMTTLFFAAVIFRRVPETRPAEAPHQRARGGYAQLLADRRFVAFWLLHCAFALVLLQFQAATPLYMERLGLGAADFSRVLLVNTILIAAAQPLIGRATERFRAAPVLAASVLVLGAGYAAYAFSTRIWQLTLATAVWSLGEIAYIPTASSAVAAMAPADSRGRYQGAAIFAWGVAGFVAPGLGSVVLAKAGPAALWLGCGALAALAAAGQLALGRANSNSTQTALKPTQT